MTAKKNQLRAGKPIKNPTLNHVIEVDGKKIVIPKKITNYESLQNSVAAIGEAVNKSNLTESIRRNQEVLASMDEVIQSSVNTAVGAMQSVVDSQMNLACMVGVKMPELPTDYLALVDMIDQMTATSASLVTSIAGMVANEAFKMGTSVLGSLLLDANTLNEPAEVDRNTIAELTVESIKPTWDDGKTKWDGGAKWNDGKTATVSMDGRATIKTQHGLLTYEEGVSYGISAEILAGVNELKEMMALEKLGKEAKKITPEQLKVMAKRLNLRVLPMYIDKIVYKAERPPLLYIGDALPIRLETNTMKQEVCRAFFGNKDLPSEPLHVEDIIKAIEGPFISFDDIDITKYGKRIYQAARHINDEVSIIMGTKERLIVNTSEGYFELNKKLVKLDK